MCPKNPRCKIWVGSTYSFRPVFLQPHTMGVLHMLVSKVVCPKPPPKPRPKPSRKRPKHTDAKPKSKKPAPFNKPKPLDLS